MECPETALINMVLEKALNKPPARTARTMTRDRGRRVSGARGSAIKDPALSGP